MHDLWSNGWFEFLRLFQSKKLIPLYTITFYIWNEEYRNSDTKKSQNHIKFEWMKFYVKVHSKSPFFFFRFVFSPV